MLASLRELLRALKKMTRLDVGHPLVGMELEELMSGGGTAQTAQHAELAIMDIGDSGAIVLTLRPGVEIDNVGEENAGELGIWLLQ